MERYSEVVGLPVICIDTGRKLGIVSDVIFCPKRKEVKGFEVERKGCEIRKKIILLNEVANVGSDAVVVKDYSCIKRMRNLNSNEELKDYGVVNGLHIYSKNGEDLGVVKDILFDCSTGSIEGLEISDGLLQDIYKGRNILPLFGKVEFSNESILVDREAVEEMSPTGGGLKKLLNNE
jgi:uncharacterized protein YrrD